MSFRLKILAAVCVPLALFAVTACGADGAVTDEANPDTSASMPAAQSSEKQEEPTGGSFDGSNGAQAGGGSDGGGEVGVARNVPACSSKNASMAFGARVKPLQGDLTLRNKGNGPCSISGFPKVKVVHTNEGGGTAVTLNDTQDNVGSPDAYVLRSGEEVDAHFDYVAQESCDTPPTVVNVDLSIPGGTWSLKAPDNRTAFPMCSGPIAVSSWARAQ